MSTTLTNAVVCCVMAAGALLCTAAWADSNCIPECGIPQSMGIQLKTDGWNTETLDKVNEIGFKIVRRGFYWNAIEKEKGKYDFSAFDEQMAHAKKLGLTVVGCLFSGNELYEENTRGGGVLTEAGRLGFAAFAAEAAKRYSDQPVVWEIWNEPNVRTFWRKDGKHNTPEYAKEYSDLVNTVVPEMLKAVPGCVVVAGSVSNYWQPSYEWTEFCFKNGVLKSGISGWSVHPYGVRMPEDHAKGHKVTRDLLIKYGAPNMPIVNTERGYAVSKTETGEGWSGGSADMTRQYQAWHFARQLLIDQLCDVRFSVWYEWNGKEFGFFEPDGTERPIMSMAKKISRELSGYSIEKRIESDSPMDYVLVLKNADEESKLAAWTCPPDGGNPDETWSHKIKVETNAGAPVEIEVGGAPVFVKIDKKCDPIRSVTISKRPAPKDASTTIPDNAQDLGIFTEESAWTFMKNTGDGSFNVVKDESGIGIGIMEYDFSSSKAKTTPYVLASCPISTGNSSAIKLLARSSVAQQLTFRLVDSTGQNLQYKTRLKGLGVWEQITIPLDKRMERWGGANDGFAKFPLKSIVFSVPKPAQTEKGKVEYACAYAIGGNGGTGIPQPAAATPGEARHNIKLYDAQTGKLVMTGIIDVPLPSAFIPQTPTVAAVPEDKAAPSLKPQNAPALKGKIEKDIFADASEWKFEKNTGDGGFSTKKDENGVNIGVVDFDFSKSKSNSTPYVLVSRALDIPAGKKLSFQVRTAVPQRLTFRLVDSTDQTLQWKIKTSSSDWERIDRDLEKKFERWGGANDGFVHFPLKSFVMSVPKPDGVTSGSVEYSGIVVE